VPAAATASSTTSCSGVGVSGVCTRTVRPQQQLLSQSEFIIWGRHTEREVKPSLQ